MFIRYRMMQQSVIHHVDDNALCVSVVCKQGMCHSTLAVRVKTCKLSFFFDFFEKNINHLSAEFAAYFISRVFGARQACPNLIKGNYLQCN